MEQPKYPLGESNYFADPLEKQQLGETRAAESAAFSVADADLQAVIDAWPTLADDVKASVLAMAKGGHGQ